MQEVTLSDWDPTQHLGVWDWASGKRMPGESWKKDQFWPGSSSLVSFTMCSVLLGFMGEREQRWKRRHGTPLFWLAIS